MRRRGCRRALGRDRRATGRRRAASARATRSGSRCVIRCTATTSRATPTRSRPASAGRARSTRSSAASAELRRIKEEGPARKLAAFVMDEKAVPRQGMPIDGGGVVTSGTHSPMLDVGIGMGYVPAAARGAGNRARDRRPRQAEAGARRQEADLRQGGELGGRCRELPGRPEVPPRARLGADRGRRGGARHHLVGAGRARRARPLRGAGRRRHHRRRTRRTARSSR